MNCANCAAGQKVLLVQETENDGYFDPTLMGEVAHVAEQLGLRVESYGVPFVQDVVDPVAALVTKMAGADCTVFLARLGDQIRFRYANASKTQIICCALDCGMLSSPFGTAGYGAFEQLKHLIDDAIGAAAQILMTCPFGTDFIGGPAAMSACGNVTRKRFPV